MTICIAAICEGGKNVIVASDRMLTILIPQREFEHESSKIEVISNNAVLTAAGDALAQRCIVMNAKKELSRKKLANISDIGELIKEIYIKCRVKRIEELFIKSRGMDLTTYYNICRNLPSEIYIDIDSHLKNANYNLVLLIAGVDNDGAHIYRILNPGILESFSKIGYCAIGSGEHMAISSFITNNYSPKLELNKALYLVYEAKKMAEHAPGVGQITDMVIISESGIEEVSSETIKKLEEIFRKRQEKEVEILKDLDNLIAKSFSRSEG